jgi:hypothetical protein
VFFIEERPDELNQFEPKNIPKWPGWEFVDDLSAIQQLKMIAD